LTRERLCGELVRTMPSQRRPVRTSSITSITSVIFDFGGVLGLPQDSVAAEAMAGLCGLPLDRFRPLYAKDRLAWDRGTVNLAGYWEPLLAAGGRQASPEVLGALLRHDIAGWTRVNPRVVRWAAALRRAGLRTAILSNMPQEILDEMWRQPRLAWMEDFGVRVFSCEVRLVKPEPAIYRLCLERLGAEPGEVVFLDDVAHNVAGAGAVGIHGMLFRSAGEAADEMESRWTLPVAELREGPDG
jgi:putative hydrolase of the HAD superfamily